MLSWSSLVRWDILYLYLFLSLSMYEIGPSLADLAVIEPSLMAKVLTLLVEVLIVTYQVLIVMQRVPIE